MFLVKLCDTFLKFCQWQEDHVIGRIRLVSHASKNRMKVIRVVYSLSGLFDLESICAIVFWQSVNYSLKA